MCSSRINMLVYYFIFLCLVWDYAEKVEMRLALTNEFPWAASIQDESMTHLCGGSVITSTHVLTACNPIRNRTSVVVMAGSTKLKASGNESWTGQNRNSSEVIIHEMCKTSKAGKVHVRYYGWVKNFALISLNHPFTFGENLHPIIPPKNLLDPPHDRRLEMVGKNCSLIGWGHYYNRLRDKEHPNNELMVVNVQLMNMFDCEWALCNFYEKAITVQLCKTSAFDPEKRDEFCALHPMDKKTGRFVGDFGGSLSCQGEFHAMLSWRPLRALAVKWAPNIYYPGKEDQPTMFGSVAGIWIWMTHKAPEIPEFTTQPTRSTSYRPKPSKAVPSALNVHLSIHLLMICFLCLLQCR